MTVGIGLKGLSAYRKDLGEGGDEVIIGPDFLDGL